MPLFKVTLRKEKGKYKNPFKPIHFNLTDTVEVEGRSWELEAKDEDDVKKLLEEAGDHPNVRGFYLHSIEEISK